MNTKITICIFLLVVSLIDVKGQYSLNASAGNASGTGGSVSYSIGQLFYTTSTASSGILSKGVQQAYEIWLVTELKDAPKTALNISTYPNPTANQLQLHFENSDYKEFSFQLTDASGKVLQQKKIIATDTQIDMHSLASAMYFLRITSDRQEIRVFKIIKN